MGFRAQGLEFKLGERSDRGVTPCDCGDDQPGQALPRVDSAQLCQAPRVERVGSAVKLFRDRFQPSALWHFDFQVAGYSSWQTSFSV